MIEAGYQLKASTLRAYLKELSRRGWLHAVLGAIDPEARLVLEAPPPASSWMDASPVEELMAAIALRYGEESLRDFSRESNKELIPYLKPILEGMLRLFGTSPATLLARMPLLTRSSIQGCEFGWTQKSPTEGVCEVRFAHKKRMPKRTFVPFVGSYELILELCGKKGKVSPREIFPDGTGANYRVSWSD